MRILLIEDHQPLADLVVKGMRQDGFGIDAFGTAEDGAAAADTIEYDAIILDLGLPDRDGIALASRLARSPTAGADPYSYRAGRG